MDMESKTTILESRYIDPNARYNSINTIKEIHPFVYIFGMKNGLFEVMDVRSKKDLIKGDTKLHDNGISLIDVNRQRRNFYTNGRDNKIKYFDFRALGMNVLARGKPQFDPIWTFGDHVSLNFNINPCFLGEDKFIVTGSKENIVRRILVIFASFTSMTWRLGASPIISRQSIPSYRGFSVLRSSITSPFRWAILTARTKTST